MNANLEKVCRSYILGRRVATAILCCVVVQYFFLSITLIPLKMNFPLPETWFRGVLNVATYAVFYLFPLCAITIVEGLMSNEEIEAERKYFGTRFAMLCNIFSIYNISMACFHSLIGGFFFHLYISIIGGDQSQPSVACKSQDFGGFMCIVESYLYSIMCGFWMGFYFYVRVFIFGSKNLILPLVQQSKLLQIKAQLKPTFKQALYDTIFPTIMFALIYYWKGNGVREKVCELLYLQFEETPLISGFVLVSAVLYSWLYSTLFLCTIYIVKFIVQIHLSEHMTFPVVPVFGETKCVTLHEALSFKKLQGMQFLGYQDLKILADKDRQRREDLFSLSQPGGHPHNWNAVADDCLKLINEFTADLSIALARSDALSATDITKAVPKFSSTPLVEHHVKPTPGLRNLMVKPDVDRPPKSSHSKKEILLDRINKKLDTLQETLLKKPVVSFFFGELPDAKIQHVLSKGQLVVWAAESLALLATASFHEDKYGVLQKDLPAIVTALLQLKQILDKLQKVGNYKKTMKSESYDIKIKNALKSSVKRSLYRITVTFGKYLTELPLTKESLHQIQNFILYRD